MKELENWKKLKNGSVVDYELIYRHYAPMLFRYGCKLCSDRDLVKDCLQQVFFNIWKGRETISTPPSIQNYLLKAVRSEIFKKIGREAKYETLSEENFLKIVPSRESDLIEEQTADSRGKNLAGALSQLPDRQREVIFLKYYNNFSYQEIADIMGIEQSSVYKLTYKAIEKLQKFFFKISAVVVLCHSLLG